MLRLGDSSKRGRPDLVHSTLLSITATPLYEDRVVKLFVHTLNDVVLEIRAGTRLPKSYFLFRNLIEKALVDKSSTDLVRVYESSLASLVRHVIRPGYVVGLSVQGRPVPLEEMVKTLHDKRNPVVLIGGFPRGHFSIATLKILDNLVRIHERPLQAQTVACRLIYEYEKLDLHTQN
jgi:rRNA small subunit pseudouridine methyltransferase Nep1